MSLTRIGRPSSTAAPTTPWPTRSRSVGDDAVGIADGVGDAQLLALLVEQVDGEGAETGQPGDELRNLGEQLLEVEHRRDFASELEQRGQQLGVGRRADAAGACAARDRSVDRSGTDYTGRLRWISLTLPLDYSAIERILPHRYPFLLVDRITELEPDKRIVGIKNVSLNERYLSHQPGEPPALPPTILTECVAQVGAILILSKPENREKLIFFMGIERVRYRSAGLPRRRGRDRGARQAPAQPHGQLDGFARVNGRVVVSGTMTFALGPRRVRDRSAEQLSPAEPRHPSCSLR